MSSQASILSQDYDCEDTLSGCGNNFETFRPRTQSTLSIPGNFEGATSRVSPTLEPPGFEDFDFPPWMDAVAGVGGTEHPVNDILDRTDQMRLDCVGSGPAESIPFAPPPIGSRPLLNGIKLEQSQPAPPLQGTLDTAIKQEPMGVQPPPSYQELNSVRSTSSQLQNALLRGPVSISQQGKLPSGMNTYFNRNVSVFNQPTSIGQQSSTSSPPPRQNFVGMGSTMSQSQWDSSQPDFISNGTTPTTTNGNGIGLPQDLENLAMPTDGQSIMLDLDMEAVLRHELSQTRDNQLHFDLP